MALLKRGPIPLARYSEDWVSEYLARRELSRDEFLEEAACYTQKDLAKKYHMQKADVGKILHLLGFDTGQAKSQKISAQNEVQRAQRDSAKTMRLLSIKNREELIQHVKTFGWNDALEHFPADDVKLLQANRDKIFPKEMKLHSSPLKANKVERELDHLEVDIKRLMKEKLSATAIARALGRPTYSGKIRQRMRAIDPSYSPEITEASREKLSQAQARLKDQKRRKAMKSLNSLPDDYISDLLIKDFLTVKEISARLKCNKLVIEDYSQCLRKRLGLQPR